MMIEKQPRPKRGREILQFIRDHGPVSIDMLFLMLDRTMSKKNLRKALCVLRRKKIIDVIRADAQTTYYQISQGLQSRVAEAATNIAFEIERTRKSNSRIIRKLHRYINGTKIDGLIYICDNGRLSETIRQLY